MKSWNDITLANFQRIDLLKQNRDLDDLDIMLFSICEIYGMTEYELDNAGEKAHKLISTVSKVFSAPFKPVCKHRIGKYRLQFDPAKWTYGQFVELMFFLKQRIQHGHYVLASISTALWKKYDAENHRKRAEFFQQVPITVVTGCINRLIENLEQFKKEYSALFGLPEEQEAGQSVSMSRFSERYGWIYSATQLAEYERIPLEEVYQMPLRQALNNLVYLKELAKYQIEQAKQK